MNLNKETVDLSPLFLDYPKTTSSSRSLRLPRIEHKIVAMKPSTSSPFISIVGNLIGYTYAYGQQALGRLHVEVLEKLLQWQTQLLKRALMGLLLISGLGFCSIAFALYLGELLGSNAIGFGLVGSGFLFLLLLTLILPNSRLNGMLQRLLFGIWPKTWAPNKLQSPSDLQKEKTRLEITANYTQSQIQQTLDYILEEIDQNMKTEKVMDKIEESIRQRVALALEQLQTEKTKDWVTMAHLIEAIGQLRQREA